MHFIQKTVLFVANSRFSLNRAVILTEVAKDFVSL